MAWRPEVAPAIPASCSNWNRKLEQRVGGSMQGCMDPLLKAQFAIST